MKCYASNCKKLAVFFCKRGKIWAATCKDHKLPDHDGTFKLRPIHTHKAAAAMQQQGEDT